MDFAQVKQLEQDYIMPTYGRFPVALEAGKGARVRDVAGKEYLDFGSGIGVNALGFCDADWADAVSAQAHKLNHTSNLYYSSIQGQLAQKLCALSGMDKVFYCNSGAESNEGAIKLARKYSYDKYGEGRSTIVTLENSFHGRTITTLAATGQDVFHNYFFPFTGGFTYAKANDLESVKAVLDESVCAIVLEGVQGEGGVIPLSEAFVSGVAAQMCIRDRRKVAPSELVLANPGKGLVAVAELLFMGTEPDARMRLRDAVAVVTVHNRIVPDDERHEHQPFL